MDAPEKVTHLWRRVPWCDEAEEKLGHLIASGRAAVLADIEAGLSHLYYVTGPHYGGWFLIRFFDEDGKGTVCHCIAFNGHNTAGGLGELARLVKNAGAVELTCTTEQEAVARLYKRQGWQIAEYFLRFKL